MCFGAQTGRWKELALVRISCIEFRKRIDRRIRSMIV